MIKAELRNDKHVLIHEGHTLLGQAAIRVVLTVGATLYTTYYTEEQMCIRDSYMQNNYHWT